VVQVDCDQAELSKGHPQVAWPIRADANGIIEKLSTRDFGRHEEWLEYCREVKKRLPLIEDNTTGEEYVSPYAFVDILSNACRESDVIIPCSSGSAFTVMMQTFAQKRGQLMVTNKGLASMGYGLSGAIGAAFANPGRRTILVEGDGGFAQNVQEIGTAQINRLNLKIFIFDDNGYASIRMTQKNYFGGRYVGCDRATGLGLPQWDALFAAYAVPCLRIGRDFQHSPAFRQLFEAEGTAAFILPIDPGQTYFPKIMSRVSAGGAMESNPLHLMSPELDDEKSAYCLCYLLGSGF
jgi:acetolactate synthase-1/2/3 large subunit